MTALPGPRSKLEPLAWRSAPSGVLKRWLRIQSGCWAPGRDAGGDMSLIRQFFSGYVNEVVTTTFRESGIGEDQLERAVRKHGEVMRGWFWDSWKLRDEERERQSTGKGARRRRK